MQTCFEFCYNVIYLQCFCVSVHTQTYFLFCWYRFCVFYKITKCQLQVRKCSFYIIYRALNSQEKTGDIPSQWEISKYCCNSTGLGYVNPLLYPGSMSVWPIPECGVLVTSIEDVTSKIPLLSLTLIRACERLKISILFHTTSR